MALALGSGSGSGSVLHKGFVTPTNFNTLKRKATIGREVCHKRVLGRGLIVFKSEDLKLFTGNFDEKNLIGATQFGKVYRGKIQNGFAGMEGRDVTVKIVDKSSRGVLSYMGDDVTLIRDEVKFLSNRSVNHHSNLVKLIGYCDDEEETMGVVYDLKPLDTLYNMTLRDEFTWVKRIKVAIGFARILEFLHRTPYVVFNLDPAHIILDQEYNPMLFDFGLLHGGSIGELSSEKKKINMSPGYMDVWFCGVGWMMPCSDVYVYGMILLQLIAKKTFDKEKYDINMLLIDEWAIDEWARKEYEKTKGSLVHNSLEKEPGYHATDGQEITDLAVQCIALCPRDRLTMQNVLSRLEGLQVAVGMQY